MPAQVDIYFVILYLCRSSPPLPSGKVADFEPIRDQPHVAATSGYPRNVYRLVDGAFKDFPECAWRTVMNRVARLPISRFEQDNSRSARQGLRHANNLNPKSGASDLGSRTARNDSVTQRTPGFLNCEVFAILPLVNRREFLAALAGSTAPLTLAHSFIAKAANLAHDPLRPSSHLLPRHNWMNDPNGPIWWKGKYHLFYQLNPQGAIWGDMHWGHAISGDMIHWRHEPIALAPTPGGADSEGCFSGSAVVFEGKPAILYTGVRNASPDQVTVRDGNNKLRETQLLAVAEDDELVRWKKDPQPVIAVPPSGIEVTGFRDPCPWREGDGWYLGVASGERGKGGCVLLYRSKDLRRWEYLHKLAEGKPNGKQAANPCDSGEMWECPDFFPLGDRHCLLYSTEGQVIWTTGRYDRTTHVYIPQRGGVLDQGAYYAPKSFLSPDGRRILWGWIQEMRPETEYAAAGWAGVMSFPRVLSVGAQGQLQMSPAKEVESLRGASEDAQVSANAPYRRKLEELRCDIEIPMDLFWRSTAAVRLTTEGQQSWELIIDIPAKEARCRSTRFALPAYPWPHPNLRMLLDGSVIEAFIGSRQAITSRIYTIKPGETDLEVTVTGPDRLHVRTWPLKPISTDRLTE